LAFHHYKREYGRETIGFIFHRDGKCCCYCGRHLKRAEATVDHYMPRFLGGSDDPANLRLACFGCNNLKGGMHPDEWEPIAATLRAKAAGRLSRYELRVLTLQRATPYWKLKYGEGVS
jgi:hypothetical protein